MNSMFEADCMVKRAWQLSIKYVSFMSYERLQKSKDSLKACFENVNIEKYNIFVTTSREQNNIPCLVASKRLQ